MAEPARQSEERDYGYPKPHQPGEVFGPDLTDAENTPNEDSAPKDTETPDRDQLSQMEDGATEQGVTERHEQQVGKGYTPPSKKHKTQAKTGRLSRRQKYIAGGSLAALIATGLAAIFLSLIPLKILHIVNNVDRVANAASISAGERAADTLFQGYLRNHLFKARCGSTISKDCKVVVSGSSNPVTQFYRGWANSRFEEKLATKYGIEFKYQSSATNPRYLLKYPGLPEEVDITDFADGTTNDLFDSKGFDRLSSNEFRNAIRQQVRLATENETLWKRTFYRYKVRSLLKAKTGLPSCIIACKKKDDFRDWKKDQKNKAMRLALTARVVKPGNEMNRLVIECFFAPKDCKDLMKFSASDDPADNGKYTSGQEKEIRSSILRTAQVALADASSIAEFEKLSKDMSDAGSLKAWYAEKYLAGFFEKMGLDKGTSKLKSKALVNQVGSKVPIVGFVLMLGQIQEGFKFMAEYGAQIGYTLNSEQMAAVYQTYRTYADEVKTGNVDAEMVGSFVDSLGPSPNADVGGTAQAEQAPLYNSLVEKGQGQVSFIDSVLPQNAYAATRQGYLCEGPGENYAPFQGPTCHTERLDHKGTPALAAYAQYEKIVKPFGGDKFLAAVTEAYNKTVGFAANAFFDLACDALGNIPFVNCSGVGKALSFVLGAVGKLPLVEDFVKILAALASDVFLPPRPITTNMSGGRTFDMIAGGADWTGNETAHNVLGGKKLTSTQVNEIAYQQEQESIDEYKRQPLLARMFDKQSPYSPISKVAMALPTNPSKSLQSSVVSLISNPLGSISNVFGSLFSVGLKPAHAATGASSNIPACSDIDNYDYWLDPSGNGLYYWATNKPLKGGPVATRKDGTYSYKVGGSSETAQAPDYCDPAAGDPFGITQYGYPLNSKDFAVDPEEYYQKNCMDGSKTTSWNADAADENNWHKWTHQPINRTTNPCLLWKNIASSAGAIYDSSLLTPEEIGESGAASIPPTSTAGSTIDDDELYKSSVDVACASGTKDIGISDGYTNGQKVRIRLCAIPGFPSTGQESNGGYGVTGANGLAVVNSRVSGAVLAMINASKASGVGLSAISTYRTMSHQQALCPCDGIRVARPGYSNHQMGLAIDFGGLPSSAGPVPGNPVWDWLSKSAGRFGYKNYVNEAWHWSPTAH